MKSKILAQIAFVIGALYGIGEQGAAWATLGASQEMGLSNESGASQEMELSEEEVYQALNKLSGIFTGGQM